MLELILSTTASIFSIVNPFGAIPLFLGLTAIYTRKERITTSLQTSLYAMGILMVFFWLGIYLLDFFGININALRIAGGMVILISGYGLLTSDHATSRSVGKKVKEEARQKDDISFTPMAMPMLAGPGSISYLINLYSDTEGNQERLAISISIILIGAIIFASLAFSPFLFKLLGRTGLRVMSRIMGFLVMAIGTQYIISGVVALVLFLRQ
jgi:multiple antibiotic resistance protein